MNWTVQVCFDDTGWNVFEDVTQYELKEGFLRITRFDEDTQALHHNFYRAAEILVFTVDRAFKEPK